MRILWYSNAPHAGSGYGNQTELFVKRIRDLGHDIAIAAYWGIQGGRVESDGITIYPAAASGGIDYESMAVPAKHHNADVIISLMDIWALPQGVTGGISIAPWFPVDSEPLPNCIKMRLTNPNILPVVVPMVFSRFAERMCRDAGIEPLYIPHGVDTNAYTPMDRQEARALIGLPRDDFIIGMVAANVGTPSRKAFKPQLAAFARLHKEHPDTRMYLHTRADTSGLRNIGGENLAEYVEQLGVGDAVSWTQPDAYHFGLEAEEMRALYCSFNVLTSVSMGEGFGIPILEAAACGIPSIVGDWTAMSELCFAGWKVSKDEATRYHNPLAAYQWWGHEDAIYQRMREAYLTGHGRYSDRSFDSRSGAMSYDADTVTREFWAPALTEIEGRLERSQKPVSRFEEAIRG